MAPALELAPPGPGDVALGPELVNLGAEIEVAYDNVLVTTY